jgi:hypothetical protein
MGFRDCGNCLLLIASLLQRRLLEMAGNWENGVADEI